MIAVRKSDDRGHADHGWLDTRHTFSFASYVDPEHTGFRALRVINEDRIKGRKGFGMHSHENMEIITYIIAGTLEHRDDMGHSSTIRRSELQRMTAGTGITHSEFNPTDNETHLLQVWINPERIDLEPEYEEQNFSDRWNPNELTLIASQFGGDDCLTIHQDVDLYRAQLEAGKSLEYKMPFDRHAWIQMIDGELTVNETKLMGGDGAAIDAESLLMLTAATPCEFLLFDLA